jgi:MerR family transcriptional regulator/heat shock protein HspR
MEGDSGRTNEVRYQVTVAARMVGLSTARVRRYLEVGLVQASASDRGAPVLGAAELTRLRKIRRLTNDLGLNQPGVEVALRLLDEIEALRRARGETP